MRSNGFSLIELSVVLLVIAIAAAAVTLRSEGPLHRARMRDVTGRIAEFDRLSRVYAAQNDKALRLNIDLARREFSRSDRRGDQPGSVCRLPAGWTIEKVVMRDKEITSGSTAISCSRHGFTPSYALLIEDGKGRRQWLLLAGLTGELVKVDDEKEIADIFAALGGRSDTR